MFTLPDRKKMSTQSMIRIVSQVIRSLEYLHSNDYIHRDISPSNIMLKDPSLWDENSHAMIIDYSIASKFKINGVHVHDGRDDGTGNIVFCSRALHFPTDTI